MQVGTDNIYIFGMRSDAVERLYQEGNYNPMSIFETNQELHKAISQWVDGTLFPHEPLALQDLYHTLLAGDWGSMADPYLVLKDFGSYSMANRRMMTDYQDREKWLRMAITNTGILRLFLLRPHHPRVQRKNLAHQAGAVTFPNKTNPRRKSPAGILLFQPVHIQPVDQALITKPLPYRNAFRCLLLGSAFDHQLTAFLSGSLNQQISQGRRIAMPPIFGQQYPADLPAVLIIRVIDHITDGHALFFGGIDQGTF